MDKKETSIMLVKPNTSLKDAICNAIILAEQNDCNVKFVFNYHIIKVNKHTNIKECMDIYSSIEPW